MGTAYEYYSKLRVMYSVFSRTGAPHSMVVVGLPEKHGYDLDFVLLAHELRTLGGRHCPLRVHEDRPDVLTDFCRTLQELPDPAMREQIELGRIDSLIDWPPLTSSRFDWVVSTASVQRLPDNEIVTYIQRARQTANYAFLFIPNSGNRAHLTLSGLRGLDIDRVLALCRQAARADGTHPPVIAAGYCDIPPFPPGLERSQEAKERAMHSPMETLAMWVLEWWCRGESLIPRFLKKRLAHLIYVALDLREDAV